MMNLQSLMDSWSLEDQVSNSSSGGGNRGQQQIDDLANHLRDKLEIDLGREQFRDLAARLIQLNLEKRQTNSSGDGGGGAAINGAHARHDHDAAYTRSQPTSTSTWHSPGQENSYSSSSTAATSTRNTNLQTLFDAPPTPAVAVAASDHERGRPRVRQQSLPHPSPRSSTPVRSFFGFGAKPAAAATTTTTTLPSNAATTTPTVATAAPTVRTRSRSPFRMFVRSGQKQELGTEEEKKEHDMFATASTPTAAAAAAPSTTDAVPAKSPVRGVARHYSGRASPMMDPSADKPFQPPRARSPLNSTVSSRQQQQRRADSPVPMRQQQQSSSNKTSPARTNLKISPVRPSPLTQYHARPGLQDDDDGGLRSPARRATTTDDIYTATSSFAAATAPGFPKSTTTRPNSHGAEQEDDESGQQPKPRHRKSLSEPMQLGDLGFTAADFEHVPFDAKSPLAAAPAAAFDNDIKLHPHVTTRRTPPMQFRTPKAAAAATNDTAAAAFKTGVGKNRRKGGTPQFSNAVPAADPFGFFGGNTSSSGTFGVATGNPVQQFTTACGGMSMAGDNTMLPNSFLDFQLDEPASIGAGSKGRGPSKRTSHRLHAYNGTTQPTLHMSQPYATAPSPPSPMEIDLMEATPPPKTFASVEQQQQPRFSMGVHIPRKHPLPGPCKARTPLTKQWQPGVANSASDGATGPVQSCVEAQQLLARSKEEKRKELVMVLRDSARELYVAKDFGGSIAQWTKAIKLFEGMNSHVPNDTLSVLLSNRAACFLMMEAFEPAIKDCIEALLHVSESADVGDPFTHDSGLPLRVKLLLRLGKAYLKSGDHKTSILTLDRAIEEATKGMALASVILPNAEESSKSLLTQMVTESTLTKSDAQKLADLCRMISTCVAGIQSASAEKEDARRLYMEALAQVNAALSIAGGSVCLFENKVALLTTMKRWRETASFLERLATSRVPWDGVFRDVDLALHNPLPGVPPAKFLSASAFTNVDECDEEAEVKLNSKACGEAVLRLPYSLTQAYLRALRLEERYPSAEAALRSLEELVERSHQVYSSSSMQSKFSWLPRECIKLNRTKKGREYGDKLFRIHDYDLAAKEYGKCLAIDGEESGSNCIGTAGGRLHAVLYCNRAACFMALHRYTDALDECAAALRIHPRYMKALLRRARCYSRLSRCDEAVREYDKWRELATEGKEKPKSSSGGSPCWFDLPREVTSADIDMVMKELEDVHITKRRMDAASREAANRRNEQQRRQANAQSHSSRFNTGAQQRQHDWQNQQNDSRRWDPFFGQNPRSGPSAWNNSSGRQDQRGSRTGNNGTNNGGSKSAHQRRDIGSPGSDLSVSHYAVLGIEINATARDVKKAYRAKALTEHPDKNIHDANAADKFRRIQMAYEVLSDAQTRYTYDLEQGYGRR